MGSTSLTPSIPRSIPSFLPPVFNVSLHYTSASAPLSLSAHVCPSMTPTLPSISLPASSSNSQFPLSPNCPHQSRPSSPNVPPFIVSLRASSLSSTLHLPLRPVLLGFRSFMFLYIKPKTGVSVVCAPILALSSYIVKVDFFGRT